MASASGWTRSHQGRRGSGQQRLHLAPAYFPPGSPHAHQPELSLFERFVDNPEEIPSSSDLQINQDLLLASSSGSSIQVIHNIVVNGADLNAVDKLGNTALHLASKYGHAELVRYFLPQMDASRTNANGSTAVQLASGPAMRVFYEGHISALLGFAKSNELQRFQIAWEELRQSNVLDRVTSSVALHVASRHGSSLVVSFLLEQGSVSVNAAVGLGMTGLHYAALGKQIECIRLLLRHKADPNIRDSQGRLPRDMAGGDRVVERVLDRFSALRRGRTEVWRVQDSFGKGDTHDGRLCDFFVVLGHPQSTGAEDQSPSHTDAAGVWGWLPNATLLQSWPTPAENTTSHVAGNPLKFPEAHILLMLVDGMARPMRRAAEDPYPVPRCCTFVLTGEDGARAFFVSLTFFEETRNPSGELVLLPKTIGVVSQWPFFSLHRAFLCELYAVAAQWHAARVPLEAMVQGYVGRRERRVEDGNTVVEGLRVRLGAPDAQAIEFGERLLLLHASGPRGLAALPFVEDVCFEVLLLCLDPDSIALLISALLTEQSILIVSEYEELLTPVCEALRALIFPLEWPHPYVPVLPRRLLSMIQAPIPFLIGIHSGNLARLGEGPAGMALGDERIASLMLVNLDTSSVVRPIEPLVGAASFRGAGALPDDQSDGMQAMIELPRDLERPLVAQIQQAILAPGRKRQSRAHAHTLARSPLHCLTSLTASTRLDTSSTSHEQAASTPLGIRDVRVIFLKLVASLIGPFYVSDFVRVEETLGTLPEGWRAFLSLVLQTQCLQCLREEKEALDAQRDSTTLHSKSLRRLVSISDQRAEEFEIFEVCLADDTGYRQFEVIRTRLLLHEEPDENSAVVACLRKGETITVIESRSVAGMESSRWLRLKRGLSKSWCLVDGVDLVELENEAELAETNASGLRARHVGRERLYPMLPRAHEAWVRNNTLLNRRAEERSENTKREGLFQLNFRSFCDQATKTVGCDLNEWLEDLRTGQDREKPSTKALDVKALLEDIPLVMI